MLRQIALFEGTDSAGNLGLWETDGSAAGTRELTGISGANTLGLDPLDLTVFNNKVLFNGADASGNGLWVTNGTAAGTRELTGISGANTSGLNPTGFTLFNGEVLFNGSDASGTAGLWLTNGTAAGTQEVTGISGTNALGLEPSNLTGISGASAGLNPSDLTVLATAVLFSGVDAGGNNGLWVTDGTAADTQELTGITDANTAGL